MQDGSRQSGQGIFLATNSFTYNDCVFLAHIFNKKFGLIVTVNKTGVKDQ
jgi:LAGLIDADG DNA endonuclease family